MKRRRKDFVDQDIIRAIEEISGCYPRWEVWSDFINICAISISNCWNHEDKEPREREYLRIIQKYQRNEQEKFSKMFAMVVSGMERNPENDLLGEIYMQLRISDNQKGQFFTPYPISKFMAQIAIEEKENISSPFLFNEPACGSGVNVIAAANTMKERGIDYQRNAYFIAQDIDSLVAKMCYIQMSLMGCPGVVIIGDTLVGNTEDMEKWYTPFHYIFGVGILYRKKMKQSDIQVFEKEENVPVYVQHTYENEELEWLFQSAGVI